ncbi:MAG: PucR family transcriptional regulator [Oscillospiraceae bacterium]
MKCSELAELRSFKNIELIAGAQGLDHTITWVYINQAPDVGQWIHGGELVFITGMEGSTADGLENTLRQCAENAASGVVVLCNPEYISDIPDSAKQLADSEKLPLYKMPWELKIVDVTKEIADTIILNQLREKNAEGFFNELLFSPRVSEQSVKRLGINCGADVNSPAAIVLLRIGHSGDFAEFDAVREHLCRALAEYMYSKGYVCVSCVCMDEIIFYINCEKNFSDREEMMLSDYLDMFAARHKDAVIRCGIGQTYKDIGSMRRSYEEAERAAQSAERSDGNISIVNFSRLGFIRLLSDNTSIAEISAYCFDVLGELIVNDRAHNTEYVKTLEAYLRCGCSMVKAADELYIHRNTMVYRIEKIRTLLGIDFNDMEAKCECMNALKLMKNYETDISGYIGS